MFELRIKNLRKILKEKKLDGLLVTNFYNIFYLTGFKGLSEMEREGYVMVTKDKVYLITDKRYLSSNFQFSIFPFAKLRAGNFQSNLNLKILIIDPRKKLIQHLEEIIKKEKIESLGFEGEDLKYFEYQGLKQKFNQIELIPTTQLIIKLREIKEEEEINKIKKACEIGDECLNSIIRIIKLGMSEKEIAWKMEKWLKERGYDFSFYPIVAIDKNSAVPHYDTKNGLNNRVKRGSIILVDFGVKYQNYCSDISRVFFYDKPKTEVINIYKKLLAVQQLTINHLKKVKSLKEVDQYCRQQLTINNQQLIYPHSTGHGVGLEVHEYPKLSSKSQDTLCPNQVFTIEPGVYFEDKWGMRIEDMVAINEKLSINILTKFSKKPIII